MIRFPQSTWLGLLAFLLWPGLLFSKPTVLVSIPPQKAFVEAIAGDAVEIRVLLRPGQSPETFSLTPKALAEMGRSDIYFTIGVPMETALLPRLQTIYPEIQIVDTAAGIRKRALEDHFHGAEENGEEHRHSADPHIWLSPGLVKIQLRHYLLNLQTLLPEKADEFNTAYLDYITQLEALDNELSGMLKGLERATVFVYHPAFGYFLDRYGLRQETVELQGKQPSPKQLRFLIALAKEHRAKVIFVQPQFNRRAAETVAKAIGGRVEPLDPLAENYLDNLRHMGEIIASSFR